MPEMPEQADARQKTSSLKILGLTVAFKAGADMERIQKVADLIEERFDNQKLRVQGGQSRDNLLIFLALDLADDLLRSRSNLSRAQRKIHVARDKIASVLAKIHSYRDKAEELKNKQDPNKEVE